jgi:hypothetical protein
MRGIVAGNDETPADGVLARMAARKRKALRSRHVRLGLAEPRGFDDLTLDPDRVGLRGDRLDHEAQQSKTVVGIFEARVGLDGDGRLKLRQQLLLIEIGPGVDELPGVGAVAGEAGAVRERLRDCGPRNPRMQPVHILPDRVVELQFAPLAQFHQSGGGEGLRMRGDTKAVARGERFAGIEIGLTERVLGYDFAPMRNGDDASGLLRSQQLEFEPVGDVVDRGSQPWFHLIDPPTINSPRQSMKIRQGHSCETSS